MPVGSIYIYINIEPTYIYNIYIYKDPIYIYKYIYIYMLYDANDRVAAVNIMVTNTTSCAK